jgi:hypothetical protein
MSKVVQAVFRETSFNCPFCMAYAHQNWTQCTRSAYYIDKLFIAVCSHCSKLSVWYDEKMVYPDKTNIIEPNYDLNEDIKKDYLEAASILNKSPRGAAALLRLSIQKLCKQLGESGKNINDDIASLVKKGLPAQIQKALDIVRVVGNESVHPGQIDLNDNQEIANKLFDLINIIAQVMITQPKEISALYENIIPDDRKEAIEKRDNK